MNKIKSIKIKDDLFVNVLPVTIPVEKESQIQEIQNQFLIFDRSGSMSGYLDDVVDTAIDYCNKLPDGSTVSLGYFSGRGDYALTVPYTLKKEINGVTTTLNSFRQALNLTNFIEILNKVNEIAGKLNVKSSMFFFTDGCHNSGGTKKDIEKALKEWTKYAQISLFVGYGYIDRDIMSWMAQITEGSFVHLNNFNNFKAILEDFGISVEDSSPYIPVEVPTAEDIIPIGFSGKSVLEYTVDGGQVKYRPSKKEFRGLFFTTQSKVKNSEDTSDIDISIERGIRALALVHSQKNNTLLSLELLSFLGDKYLIQSLYNSISPDEFSESETKIRKSIFSPKERFLEGTVKNFLPDPNAFCVMDAINILSEDENVKLYVRDKDFEYTRIGKKTEQTDGPFVEYPDDLAVAFNDIVMNKERLNLSISTYTSGMVSLDPAQFKNNPFTKEDLAKFSLPDKYKVSSFRTYSVISDGRLQTKKLVVSDLSKDTINKLGTILTRRPDGKYIVDFTALPVINKKYVKMTSAKTLAEKMWEEKLLSDEISVYNYFKKKYEKEDKKDAKDAQQVDQLQFLVDHCYIKNGSYNPPMKTIAGEDEYEAYSFSIDLKGYTKPSVSEVIKKLDAKKNTTPRELIIKEAYDNYMSSERAEDEYKAITKHIASLTTKLKDVRRFIQLSKFAVILGNKGQMDEFKSRENMELSLKVKSLSGQSLDLSVGFNIEKITVKI